MEQSAVSFGAIIQKYRVLKGMNQTQLANQLQISRNAVGNWETDKSRPDVDTIKTLCSLLSIPINELFSLPNQGVLTSDEQTHLAQYRLLDAQNKEIVDSMINVMLRQREGAVDEELRAAYDIIPLHSTPVAAGTGCAFNEENPEHFFVRKNRFSGRADALVRVSGASMEPLYHDGDFVYIKYTQSACDGEDVICSTADGAVIKRMAGRKLYSLNNAFPFGEKSEDDHVVILARVLGIVSDGDLPSPIDALRLEKAMAPEIRHFEETYGIS